ncbi:TatD DNase family protein [Malonomonas rubra DSM 5091]|uniref:TatD DNase family protein n=1 Tax=Malonomonas rubra DSM 5091 TaxID=1122189 RepID=A0A1M6G4F5_MALRU|nr:TatD family hydrolase [Malonomonas rubra]SHJ04687.1 TatD DNase family protein [Malonomonas rubra DSM 5091]
MSLLIDTHAHIDAPELNGTGLDLLQPAQEKGIGALVVPGVRVSGWQNLLQLAEQFPALFAAPGLHPVYAQQWNDAAAEQLQQLCTHPKAIAMGEIGLDGVSGPDMMLQERVLRAQLEIALQAERPVLLHGRKATGRLLDILRQKEIGKKIGGIWHGFSGSLQVAEELVRLGFKIGVGPIILRDSARKLPQAVQQLPLAALVLETDLPDMAETPEALIAVAEKVAELRGISLAEVAQSTSENARKLFKIDI